MEESCIVKSQFEVSLVVSEVQHKNEDNQGNVTQIISLGLLTFECGMRKNKLMNIN